MYAKSAWAKDMNPSEWFFFNGTPLLGFDKTLNAIGVLYRRDNPTITWHWKQPTNPLCWWGFVAPLWWFVGSQS